MSFMTRFAAAALLSLSTALPSSAQEGSFTISVTFGPTADVPDPRAGYNGWMSNQTGVTETLMGIDYDLNLYPHDGSPVTAQTVIDAIAPISDENHAGYNARIAGVLDLASMTVVGDLVVEFETNSPNAAFEWSLSDPGVAIIGVASADFPINATGPYIFREAITEQLYRAEANTAYRLGTPGFEEIRVVASPDPAAAALAFEAGDVDMVINYPETDFERIQATGALGFTAPTARLYFYSMNTASGPLANPLIRQAVSLAVDRNGIVDAVLSGVGGVPAGTIYPAGKGWAADIAPTYDPARAEELLAEAGAVKEGGRWMLDGEPLEIEILTYASRAALPPTAEITQAFLQQIGVTATVSVGEYGASNDALLAGDADMFLQAWVMLPQGDPASVLGFLLASEGGSNAGRYANPTMDQLLIDGQTTFGQAEREAIYDEVQQIIATDVPLLPVFHVSQANVAKAGLTGYAVHPTETYWITHETALTE